MTTHRQIILRELPATKTTDPGELARAAPCRYSAEWEIDEGSDDETDPLWGMIGFGATEAAAHADLAAQTARAWREQTDEELRGALGELADDAATMEAAIARAEQLAMGAINTATGSPFDDAQDSERLLRFAQEWTATAAALRRLLAAKPEPTEPATADPTQESPEADEGPEPYRLRGDDEEGWMIDDDPLLRVWDTAADAMAEVLGDWWEEEPGCWMATAIESARPGDADKPPEVK